MFWISQLSSIPVNRDTPNFGHSQTLAGLAVWIDTQWIVQRLTHSLKCESFHRNIPFEMNWEMLLWYFRFVRLQDKLFLWQHVRQIICTVNTTFFPPNCQKYFYVTNKWFIFTFIQDIALAQEFLFSKCLVLLVLELGIYCAVFAKWTFHWINKSLSIWRCWW